MNSLDPLLDRLEAHYGAPEPPRVTDPFEMILLENASYLVNDAKREATFRAICDRIGSTPKAILQATDDALKEAATKGGMLRDLRIDKLRTCAEIAISEFGGNLNAVVNRPLADARKALKLFPGIGEPSADRILLFSRAHPVFSMDSNMLRTLLRIGYGEEKKNYAASYRSVMSALQPHLRSDFEPLIRAYQLLRRHGQETCKNHKPRCPACPVYSNCCWPIKG